MNYTEKNFELAKVACEEFLEKTAISWADYGNRAEYDINDLGNTLINSSINLAKIHM